MYHHILSKYIWTFSEGKPHSPSDCILIDRFRHSNVLDIQSFEAADCDTDHYLVMAKVREGLGMNKQRPHRFHIERLSLMNLR
jgi:hypothetical protein